MRQTVYRTSSMFAGRLAAALSIASLGLPAFSLAQAANITLSAQQAAGLDWNNAVDWSDGQAAADSAAANPSGTYEILAGARLRTPNNGTDDTFPGSVLMLDGDGVWVNNPAAGNTTVAEIRFKQDPSDGMVTFPKLVMNGGQLDTGNDGTVTIAGEMNIAKNAPIYNDSANDRGYIIAAKLTGSANIEYHGYNQPGFMASYTHNLNIAGASNTFSGKWNVVLGTLLGTGSNSLGTNDISVGANGALETTYDINNPKGGLQLNGQLFLHQDDSFRSVTVGTTALTKGKHTFDELSVVFPTNFPASWTAQFGADAFGSGSGSITVLEDNTTPVTIVTPLGPVTAQVGTTATLTLQVSGPVTSVQWYLNNVAIPGATGLSYTTGLLTPLDNGAVYKVVVSNSVNSVESSATLQVTLGARVITLSVQQASGVDWNTAGNWSDGNPVSVSALANVDNIYEVLPGARLRSPNNGTDDTFPGSVLKIDGSGVWVNNPAAGDTNTSEIRFKQAASDGKVTFPKLVMNGGQLDTGNDGTVTIAGEIEIAKNAPFYNDNVNDRGYVIEARLTGSANIEYHGYSATAFNSDYTHNLNIAGASNTFSGKWNVVMGTLLGTGANALGTNDITIGENGALETTYDIANSGGSLQLSGKLYLHQNDTFRSVTVGTTALAKGKHTFEELSASFPDNFPAGWTPQIGADAFGSGSGSINVLGGDIPVQPVSTTLKSILSGGGKINFAFASQQGVNYAVEYKNALTDAAWQTLTTLPGTGADLAVSDTLTAGARFYRVRTQ